MRKCPSGCFGDSLYLALSKGPFNLFFGESEANLRSSNGVCDFWFLPKGQVLWTDLWVKKVSFAAGGEQMLGKYSHGMMWGNGEVTCDFFGGKRSRGKHYFPIIYSVIVSLCLAPTS